MEVQEGNIHKHLYNFLNKIINYRFGVELKWTTTILYKTYKGFPEHIRMKINYNFYQFNE